MSDDCAIDEPGTSVHWGSPAFLPLRVDPSDTVRVCIAFPESEVDTFIDLASYLSSCSSPLFNVTILRPSDLTPRINSNPSIKSFDYFLWMKERDTQFDVIYFPESEGIGFFTLESRRQGLHFQSVSAIVIFKHHRSRLNSIDLETIYLERESIEMADYYLSSSRQVIEWTYQGFEQIENTNANEAAFPTVSLCITFRSIGVEALRTSLESIAVQSIWEVAAIRFKVIIVDRLEDERARTLLRRYGEKYGWTVQQGNRLNTGQALNLASGESRGSALMFISEDSIPFDSESLFQLVDSYTKRSLDVVTSTVISKHDRIASLDTVGTYLPRATDLGLFGNTFGSWNLLIRSSTFRRMGGFPDDLTPLQLWLFYSRFKAAGYAMEVIVDPLFIVSSFGSTLSIANTNAELQRESNFEQIIGILEPYFDQDLDMNYFLMLTQNLVVKSTQPTVEHAPMFAIPLDLKEAMTPQDVDWLFGVRLCGIVWPLDVDGSFERLDLILVWEAVTGPLVSDWTSLVFLYHENDSPWKSGPKAQNLRSDTFDLRRKSSRWVQGEIIIEERSISLPVGAPSGRYKVAIGLYNKAVKGMENKMPMLKKEMMHIAGQVEMKSLQ